MTELYIFGKIIWDWRNSLEDWQKNRYCNAYRFLFAADIWVFVNLGLALIISVPAFNLFTHGTHITVAHAMGSTIGINTMILLASIFYVIREELVLEVNSSSGLEGIETATGKDLAGSRIQDIERKLGGVRPLVQAQPAS